MISGGFSRGAPVAHWHSIDTLNSGPTALPLTSWGAEVWPTADGAVYVPLAVRNHAVVKGLWYAGANPAVGNYDIGLYDATGAAILRRGSTARVAFSEQVWDCTDTPISPGIYYVGLVYSSATDGIIASIASAPLVSSLGVLTEAAALPLPATATFAISHALLLLPVVGMFLDTRVT